MGDKVCLWKRVSDDQQDLRSQNAVLDSHVARNSYDVRRVFELPDTSAFKLRQLKALAEALADVQAGSYTRIVAVTSSRFLRSDERIGLDYLLALDRAGGRLEAADNPLFGDLTSTAGWLITVTALGADHAYSKNISEAVKRGNREIDLAGGFRGGRRPFGYRSTGEKRSRKLVPDEVAAPVVREMFEMIAQGKTTTQVSAWLEARGIRKTNSSIMGTIRRAVYRTGRYEVTDHEGIKRVHITVPLVSAETWRNANASLDSRPATNAKPRRPHRDDWSGVLYDTHGHVVYRNWYSGKVKPDGTRERRRVYRCDQCTVSWDADRADDQVEAMMSGDKSPEWHVVTIAPVQVRQEKLEAIAEQLRELPMRNLPEEEEDRLRLALRAERRAVQAMPADEEIHHEIQHTGRSRGDAWDQMTHLERVAFLRAEPFQLQLHGRGMDVVVRRVFVPTLAVVPTDRPSVIFGTIPNYPPDRE